MSNYKLLNHPYVQQALQQSKDLAKSKDLESDVKIPFVIKDKVLMAPGVWNNFFYTPESVEHAFNETDWTDKEISSLFLDHEDKNAREWVGEVRNPRMVGEQVLGDLHVVDKSTAVKLAFGAKMGISPKVTGEEENGTMMEFLFDNFSVVINPAVKKAYINNSQRYEGDKQKDKKGSEEVSELAGELDPKGDIRPKSDSQKEVNQMAKEKVETASTKLEEEAAPAPEKKEEEAPKEEAKPESEDKPEEKPEGKEEEKSEEKAAEAKPEDKSEELGEFTSFAQKFMADNLGKSVTEAMAAYEEHKKDPVLARISGLESANKALSEQVKQLSEKLEALGKAPEKKEEAKEELSEKKEEAAESTKVTKEMNQKTEKLD